VAQSQKRPVRVQAPAAGHARALWERYSRESIAYRAGGCRSLRQSLGRHDAVECSLTPDMRTWRSRERITAPKACGNHADW
jgi:hypothetical protein